MTPKKDLKPGSGPDPGPPTPESGFSRRGFLRGAGVSTGAAGGILIEQEAQAAQGGGKAMGPGAVPISLTINGKPHQLTIEPRVTLLDALRNHLDMTGAKRVCDRGTCGSCTVLLNGKVVYACSVLAIDAQGKQIQTIEGLVNSAIPQAFVNHDAQQCGYCTPGFVMAAKGLLDRTAAPTREQVEKGLGGNLCRCGTYYGMSKAVLEAAKTVRGGRNA